MAQVDAARDIAAGYAVEGAAVELGAVSVDGVVDAGTLALGREITRSLFGTGRRRR